MERIASFSVDHDFVVPDIYVSRIDGDITTYDLRTRVPNADSYMDHSTMHTLEHMFATFVRNSSIASRVLYFGPMGCQTGFYLLVRDADNDEVLSVVKDVLGKIIAHDGEVFGASRKECGNYKSLDLDAAKRECRAYLEALESRKIHTFEYPTC
jgi:S-ribosylhomocysteine lyase